MNNFIKNVIAFKKYSKWQFIKVTFCLFILEKKNVICANLLEEKENKQLI